MSYSDAPVPSNPEAQFAIWRKYIDEQIARLVRPKTSRYVITITGTTNATGYLTFTHDAQVTPQAILIQVNAPDSPAVWCGAVDTITETTARARFKTSSGGAVIDYAGSITFFANVHVI